MQYQSASSSPQLGREKSNIAKLVCKRLVFWIRLVLYWPPIGPQTKQQGIGVFMNIRRSTLIGTAIAFALYNQSAAAQTVVSASYLHCRRRGNGRGHGHGRPREPRKIA